MMKNENSILVPSVLEQKDAPSAPLKVSVLDTGIHYFSVSIGLGLMWQESQP